MSVYDHPCGRLGNAMFRYLASSIFAIVYKLERNTYGNSNINEVYFNEWKNQILNNEIPQINLNENYTFNAFCQHDDIIKKYKIQLIEYINNNPNHELITQSNMYDHELYRYNTQKYKSLDILTNHTQINKYDVVVHLRLEDFIHYNLVMNPICLLNILDNYKQHKICIVVNKIQTEIEQKYINYFKNRYDIILESNDVITDYHIMKNAKILICSCSTLSWVAALFTETAEKVYIPNINSSHQTFKNPHENTIVYNYTKCSKEELNNII